MELDPSTPVVVLHAGLAALGIMRSLGKKGVAVHAVESNSSLPALRSRYCAGHLPLDLHSPAEATVSELLRFAEGLGRKAVLFWTSDETAVFCARHAEALSSGFLMPRNDPQTIERLQDKGSMYELALEHGVAVPRTEFPRSESEVRELAAGMAFPLMLKGMVGSRLFSRTGRKMQLVHDVPELMQAYTAMEDPESPNLMLQEAIPGADDQVYIFNGYFDGNSDCLNPYTGHKLRQYPVHVGCASLGICLQNDTVAATTERFMKGLNYRGILDIGYRLDPRDGQYKVLDVNPRIGQAFRIFVGTENEDVCRDLYLDLTGQRRLRSTPREGRKWMIEDYDLISSFDYRQEGTLGFADWISSLRGVEELAWWWSRDPLPAASVAASFMRTQASRRLRGAGRWIGRIGMKDGATERAA